MCRPPADESPGQGWKLHVSATLLSAPVVLARAADVLVGDSCAFKFARGLRELGELLSPGCDRGSGGKFITAYPRDNEQFRRVARELDLATDGLPGPRIMSDRRLRPGSSVYYRYGGMRGLLALSDEGSYEPMLAGPDGQLVKDERLPYFRPPHWAASPLPPDGPDSAGASLPPTASGPPGPALAGGRFRVRAAIRHSYRGGLFRATDAETGAEVILRQARPHTMSSLTGEDARDLLRHEARILELLGPAGLAPRLVALFTAEENLFLAQERVPGVSLHTWVAQRAVAEWRGRGAPPDAAVAMARQVADLVAAVHARGLVLRDLKPGNLMVTPDGEVRLIDLETVAEAGARVTRTGTPGYAAPEQEAAPWFGPAPAPPADLFSLGATILYLASGISPLTGVDKPATRTSQERLGPVLAQAALQMPAVARLAPLISALAREAPEDRCDLEAARAFLADGAAVPQAPQAGLTPGGGTGRLVTDGLAYLLREMRPDASRLWRARDDALRTDPGNVQHGAAGVLGVLTQAARDRCDQELAQGIATAAAWVDKRLTDIPKVLPGLHGGRAGTAWALHDAARLLGDDGMAAHAVALARQLPVRSPRQDVGSGTAGAGLVLLHLLAATDDPELRDRAIQAADGVLSAALPAGEDPRWPALAGLGPASEAASRLAFPHGIAGLGAFLLYSALATGRQEYLQGACRAGDALAASAATDGEAAWWPAGPKPGAARERHWCNGASGVGTFLVRLWAVTGEQRFRDLAHGAAVTVHEGRWYSGNGACHGLAGDGDFLCDLTQLTGDQRYHGWAGDLAALLDARHVLRDGLALITDDSLAGITAAYGTGLAGPLSFLLRLRRGGPRLWLPDHLLPHRPATSDERR
jgi:hypothetical protein